MIRNIGEKHLIATDSTQLNLAVAPFTGLGVLYLSYDINAWERLSYSLCFRRCFSRAVRPNACRTSPRPSEAFLSLQILKAFISLIAIPERDEDSSENLEQKCRAGRVDPK